MKVFKKAFLPFLITIVLFIFADLILSILKPSLGVHHYIYDHTLNSNQKIKHTWGKSKYDLFTNNLGFKSKDNQSVSLKKPSQSTYRVAVIGDSFTEGVGLPYEQTFVGVLDKELNKDYQVLNLGVSSYAPSVYQKKVEYWISKGLEIDELIVMVDLSDIEDEAYFYRDNKNIIIKLNSLSNQPFSVENINFISDIKSKYNMIWNNYLNTRNSSWIEKYDVNSSAVQIESWIKSYLTHSWSYRKYQYITHFKKIAAEHKKANKNIKEYTPLKNIRGLYLIDENIFHQRSALAGMTKIAHKMDSLKDLLKERNIKLKIGIYPWPSELHYSSEFSIWEEFWKKYTSYHNIELVNVYDKFRNLNKTAKDIQASHYIPGDYHFNEKGNQIIGEYLATFY